ncbi:MAG: winged helix-turn-helix domain-containing protein, partial [Candidatus Binatia bacterium]
RFTSCVADLWLAIRLHRSGRVEAAKVPFSRAVEAAQRHEYDFLFTRVSLLGPRGAGVRAEMRSLLRGVEHESLLPYAARLQRELEPSSSAHRVRPTIESRLAAPLAIQTFGPFRVWCNEREIERSAWGRERALHLLQYLVCRRGKFVHREQILEALWGDTPVAAAAIGLRVALSTLRKVLAACSAHSPSGAKAARGTQEV